MKPKVKDTPTRRHLAPRDPKVGSTMRSRIRHRQVFCRRGGATQQVHLGEVSQPMVVSGDH